MGQSLKELQKKILDLTSSLSKEQLKEFMIKAESIITSDNVIFKTSIKQDSSQKGFLENPQEQGLWKSVIEIRRNSQNQRLLDFLDWKQPDEDEDYFYAFSYPIVIKRLFNFLFELLPEREKSDLQRKHDKILDSPYFPFARKPSAFKRRYFKRESTEQKTLSTLMKKRYCQEYRSAISIYRHNLCNFIYYESNSEEDFHCFFDFDKELVVRIQRSSQYKYEFLCIDKNILQLINHLFIKLGIIDEQIILTKLVRPERELLEHYVQVFVSTKWQKSMVDPQVIEPIRVSLHEFDNENYSYSVRSSGLAMEEILVDMYETYLRRPFPPTDQPTLTHIWESLINEAKILLAKTRTNLKEKNKLVKFDEINKIIQRAEESNDPELLDFAKIIRGVMQEVIEILKERKDVKEKDIPILFPARILNGIKNTTKLRNNVSHRSQGRIGRLESAKALQGVYLLSNWWNKEKSLIKWDQSKEEIFLESIERNNPPILP